MTRPLRILIGCETSGIARRAFAVLGHDVWSCDIDPAEDPTNRHIICDTGASPMTDMKKLAALTSEMLATHSDISTAPSATKPRKPPSKNRDKVKAARKQRRRSK